MCRLLIFAGTCTRCGEDNTWHDLSQQLSCLRAKNNGAFGECDDGVFAEQHGFDQECDRCADEDEGVGDVGEDDMAAFAVAAGKQGPEVDEARTARKRQRRDASRGERRDA